MLKNYMTKMKRRAGGMIAMMVVVALVASNLTNTAQAAAGDLDTSFGAGGKVTTNILSDFNSAQAVAIQSDGKIVAAGFVSPGNNSQADFALARYSGEQGTVFNVCVQDDSTRSTLRFNSTTGDYLFTRCGNGGFTVGGKGAVTVKGCAIILQQYSGNVRLVSKVDTCVKRATASLQLSSGSYTLADRNITDNTCACPN